MSSEVIDYAGSEEPTSHILRPVYMDKSFELTDLRNPAENEAGLNDFDARDLLLSSINLDAEHSLIRKRYSQTPLDPSFVSENGAVSYEAAVVHEMDRRMVALADRTGIDGIWLEAVHHEIILELQRRIVSNDRAGTRLFEALKGQRISQNDADLIWRAKTGEASMAETGELLLRYPIMMSIEAFKYTEPLDWTKIDGSIKLVAEGLGELNERIAGSPATNDFTIKYMSQHPDARKWRQLIPKVAPLSNYQAALQAVVGGWKENIAEITLNNVTIELVMKTTVVKMDPEVQLRDVRPRQVKSGADIDTNLQPISRCWYWRVKPSEEK